ncbi:hypothetical protein HMPREF1869_01589 [Bacteroidales bacterium KA00251]|nr:hypothetical protein HMPREF1869_01589 [Bacteroidales bacterium KA00251]
MSSGHYLSYYKSNEKSLMKPSCTTRHWACLFIFLGMALEV